MLKDRLITAQNLSYSYENALTPTLKNLNFEIKQGEFTAILGPNGSGKTTLLNLIAGLKAPSAGTVTLNNTKIHTLKAKQRVNEINYLFQNPDFQIYSPSVELEIQTGPQNLNLSVDEIKRRTQRAIDFFSLEPYLDTPPSLLSFGIRRKICLASILAMDSPIWILDEPTVGLDRRGIFDLKELLKEQSQKGKTIIVISHNMDFVLDLCHSCLLLKGGTLLDHLTPGELFSNSSLLSKVKLLPPDSYRLETELNSKQGERLSWP